MNTMLKVINESDMIMFYIAGVEKAEIMIAIQQAEQPISRITDQRLQQIRDAYLHLAQKGERSNAPLPVIQRSYEMVAVLEELLNLRVLRNRYLTDV